ncbi:MAG: KpsF/GutQ family sugar-phosphate isomerase [Pseudomonadales bacterium]
MVENTFIEVGQRTVRMEADAVASLVERIDARFSKACEILLRCQGRIVVTGMGKSGHIANKIAATLASTGSPAFFVHPGEASHGDLGMITKKDVVIALSNSGNTAEITTILPLLKRQAVPLISLTGNPSSLLAEHADVNLDVGVAIEACPLDLAPTSSTTVSLVMGDALAIALLEARGFSAEDFAYSHPGGTLGKRLLLKVDDVMRRGDSVPKVGSDTVLKNALLEMSSKGLGMTTVVNAKQKLLGIFTDGDLRRALDNEVDFQHTAISAIMTTKVKTVTAQALAASALSIMEDFNITVIVVVNDEAQPIGAVHMHDLLKAGLA